MPRARLDLTVEKKPAFKSKQKGSNWEIQICRALSLWISEGKRADVFWRSAMSGGRATIGLDRGFKHKAQAGDISAIAALGERLLDHFVIESKFYKDLQLTNMVLKENGFLHDFWMDQKTKAIVFDKQPMLIGRQNTFPPFVMMNNESMEVFNLTLAHSAAILPRLRANIVLFDVFLREATVPSEDVYISTTRRARL